jgi:hypothetical protein
MNNGKVASSCNYLKKLSIIFSLNLLVINRLVKNAYHIAIYRMLYCHDIIIYRHIHHKVSSFFFTAAAYYLVVNLGDYIIYIHCVDHECNDITDSICWDACVLTCFYSLNSYTSYHASVKTMPIDLHRRDFARKNYSASGNWGGGDTASQHFF